MTGPAATQGPTQIVGDGGRPARPAIHRAGVVTGRDAPMQGTQPMPELRPGTEHCWDCHDDLDNHYPCGVPGCRCWCQDPDTPARMKRPPAVTR